MDYTQLTMGRKAILQSLHRNYKCGCASALSTFSFPQRSGIGMKRNAPRYLFLFLALFIHSTLRADDKTDPALPALENARKAYNEGKSDAAANAFREFLKQFPQHKEAPAAQYGLGLALLELPQKDYKAAIAALQVAAGKSDFPERAAALYYLGTAQRAVGLASWEQIAAKPNESANLKKAASENFAEALKSFTASGDAYAERLKAKSDSVADQDGLLRSRADQADILLRDEKNKEAADLAESLLKDKAFEKNPLRDSLYYALGCARFALKDNLAAGRALSQLAPFDQDFGLHARYLLSRIHHLDGARPEANTGYKSLLADYDAKKKVAVEAMKNPAAIKPEDRLRMEGFVKPAPEFVARAMFYSALIAAESGEFGEAVAGLGAFTQQFPNSLLIEEARLRLGYCYMQVKNAAESQKLLQPLHAHAKFGDRAMWWTAKAQLAAADPANAQAYAPIAKAAIALLQKAADKAGETGKTDAEAKARRGDILLDTADAQLAAHQEKDGAATYHKIVDENPNTDLAEMAMQREATALHLAGQFKESDEVCQKFEKAYPKSTLLQAVWFRGAENASLSAMAVAADPNNKAPRAETDKKFDDAIARYQKLITKYPEFQYVNVARFGMGTAQYQRGKYDEAIETLSMILDGDRNGELAAVNYLQADALIRTLPGETEDALEAASMIDRAETASKLLDKYAGAQGKTPLGADALLKLGHCYQRIGMLMVDPAERNKILTQARQVYEKLMAEMNNTPSFPAAVMERARCLALLGDIGGAMNEYNRFNQDPLQKSSVAPMAVLRLVSMMRSQNRAQDAVNLMVQARTRYESTLQKDSTRADWVAMIQIEHALALKDLGKVGEARPIFESVAKQFEKRPEGLTALWRAAQCKREELQTALAAAHAMPLKPGVKPEELAAATKTIDEGIVTLRQLGDSLKGEAAKITSPPSGQPKVQGPSETPLRMLYEAAWCYRALADEELAAARTKLSAKANEKVMEELKKVTPPQPLPTLVPSNVALKDLPEQPGEKAAQEQYNAMLALDSSTALSIRARTELAEMQMSRGQNDPALEHLATALEDNPPRDLAERIRVRLGSCLLAKDDVKGALANAQFVAKNQASPQMADDFLLMGECQMQNKDWNQAINQFVVFRDRDPFRNMGAITERGLFRLGQAFAEAKRWDESRQVMDQVAQRFPQSPLVPEARYAMGFAFQNMNQHDNACNAFAEVTKRTAGEVAARAQLNIGLCRLAQKRFPDAAKELQKVPAMYDVPELSATALCEAGQAFLEDKKPDEARKLWQGVIKDYAATKAAETAKKRLAELK